MKIIAQCRDFTNTGQYLLAWEHLKNKTHTINNCIINNCQMDTINGYKVAYEKKRQILYSRMDDSMVARLRDIRKKTGISVSEIIRESVRRLLQEIETTGSINLKIN